MVHERELTGLLHRADWTRLALSGSVRGDWPVVTMVTTSAAPPRMPRHGEPPEPPLRPFFASARDAEADWSLTVAPGRRFLVRNADGSRVLGNDGERVWQWLGDLPADESVVFDGRTRPPFGVLLAPSWLLGGYALVLDGEVTVCGRAGVRVLGTPRAVTAGLPRVGGRFPGGFGDVLFSPVPRWLSAEHWDEVDAVVDAELGILLRCSRRADGGAAAVTEFTALEVGQVAESAAFAAPAGSVYGGSGFGGGGSRSRYAGPAAGASFGDSIGEALGGMLGSAGREAAKTFAGMAAGGLGAMIRYGPSRRPDPFARATEEAEDPEAAMPADEQAPDSADSGSLPAVPDEVLHLLYRSGLAAPRFAAALHKWLSAEGFLAAVPSSARDAGFGGVGFLVDAIRDKVRQDGGDLGHSVSAVRMGGWAEYRIDLVHSHRPDRGGPRRGRDRSEPVTIASDGTRQWQVFADRVVTGPARPAPDGFTAMLDTAWLLERDLSGGTETSAGGRRGYRIVVRQREAPEHGWDWWERFFLPTVVVVDAETGRLLRVTLFKGGLPVFRQELRDVAELDGSADFGFTPPSGLPVEDTEADRNEDSARPSPSWRWAPPAR
jgi:hypothetical protein